MLSGTPMCMGCTHKNAGVELKCKAFPTGIPMRIVLNTLDHRQPVEGDNGIRYEAKNEGHQHGFASRTQVQSEP